MSTLTHKLSLHQANEIHILNKPDAFDKDFMHLDFEASLVSSSSVDCVLVFTNTKEEFMAQMLTLFPRMQDSSILWVAYPIQTPKSELTNLYGEFNWDFLGYHRLKPSRLVTLNSNWNAIKLKKATV